MKRNHPVSAVLAGPLLWLAATTAGPVAAEPIRLDKQDFSARMEQIRKDWNVPGMAVAIVSRDGMIHAEGYGVRALGSAAPVDADTMFQINSMTKSFTALLVARRAEEGKLKLTDRIVDHIGWFRLGDPLTTMEVTLEDALSHRTGVVDSTWLEDVPGMTMDETVRRMRHFGQASPLRAAYYYDNTMFSTAGYAATVDGGWSATLRKEVLEPLGLRRTVPDILEIVRPEHRALCHECQPDCETVGEKGLMGWSNVASPHVLTGGKVVLGHWRGHPQAPGANMASSANDMAVYLRAILSGLAASPGAPLSRSVVEEVLRPRIPTGHSDMEAPPGFAEEARRANMFWRVSYALGWECTVYAGERLCHHAGASLGFLSWMAVLPDKGLGFVVLTNMRNTGEGAADVAAMHIADLLVGNAPADWSGFFRATVRKADADAAAQETELRRTHAARRPPITPTAQLAGTYTHPAYGSLRVSAHGAGRLRLDHGPQRQAEAVHLSANVYELRWKTPRNNARPLGFDIDASGQPVALTLHGARFVRESPAP